MPRSTLLLTAPAWVLLATGFTAPSVNAGAEVAATSPVRLLTSAGEELAYAFASLPMTGSSGKTHRSLGLNTILYRAREEGDFVSFRFAVPEAGRYELSVSTFDYNGRATVCVSVDAAELGRLDMYAPKAYLHPPRRLGEMDLAGTEHTITVRVVGKNAKSANFNVALDELRLRRVQ